MSQVYVSRILQSSKVLASQSRIEFFILACIICEGQGYTGTRWYTNGVHSKKKLSD